MKTIKEEITLSPFLSRTLDFYFGGMKSAVFDIETTGLNPAYCSLMLSGILLTDGKKGTVIQYFAERPEDEKEILEKTIEVLSETDYVLTYNGRHFDLPFVKKRAKRYGLDASQLPYTLDLYLVLNGYSPFKSFLPDLKQKTVEVFMGLASSRDDQISGKENIDLYQRYLETGAEDLKRKILLHNHDDLIQLYKLLPVISKTDFHRAMFSLGYPLKEFTVTRIFSSGRDIRVTGSKRHDPVDYISFYSEEQPYNITMSGEENTFDLTIPCFNEKGCLVSDIYTLLGDRAANLESYPDVVNGYLITSTPDGLNHFEINAMVKEFLNEVFPLYLG